jgi:hypothetical protein
MAMNAANMAAKVKAAYATRTGKTLQEGDFMILQDLCAGIILEIQTAATISATGTDNHGDTVTVTGPGGSVL